MLTDAQRLFFTKKTPINQNNNRNKLPLVWSIAGQDSSHGAGVDADKKSFIDFSIRYELLVTAETVQGDDRRFQLNPVNAQAFTEQLTRLYRQEPPSVIKLGALANKAIVMAVVNFLTVHPKITVIYDPVMRSSAGNVLLEDDALDVVKTKLLALVDILTPNLHELQWLTATDIRSYQDIKHSAKQLLDDGVMAVYVKAGHYQEVVDQLLPAQTITDFFIADDNAALVTASREFYLQSRAYPFSVRGTGCRLASAMAALVALQFSLDDVVCLSKAYIDTAIEQSIVVSSGERHLAERIEQIQLANLAKIIPEQLALTNADGIGDFPDCDEIDLYPVVDDVAWLEKLLPLGIKTIQLRLKDKSQAELNTQIKRAVQLQQRYSAQLFINDYWQLAIEHGAYGVHLGQEDLFSADLNRIAGAGLRLGVSTHSWWEIARAHAIAPSYIAIGPIFPTQTKVMPFASQGLEQLSIWFELLGSHYRVVAIGGINQDTIEQVLNTGVTSIAVVSAITQSDDYSAASKQLLAAVMAAKKID